jgi:hypothetical protein
MGGAEKLGEVQRFRCAHGHNNALDPCIHVYDCIETRALNSGNATTISPLPRRRGFGDFLFCGMLKRSFFTDGSLGANS